MKKRVRKLVFADSTESIFLADMSGDGLTDLVRIRNGEVCYWPNLGYGRFGAKVTMDHSPRFDRPDLFDGRRIRLADIDGSGTADIIYFAGDASSICTSTSRAMAGARGALWRTFPRSRACLVGHGDRLARQRHGVPGVVVAAARQCAPSDALHRSDGRTEAAPAGATSRNNLGAETVVQYAPSTKFYVADKLAGTPWVTRLPFPVHVVERVETYDYISRNRFVTRYAYHHGYYDGVEREFRGFGRVDQWDTQEIAHALSRRQFSRRRPTRTLSSRCRRCCTKTWFHTGAFFGEAVVSRHSNRNITPKAMPAIPLRVDPGPDAKPCCSTTPSCPATSCFPTAAGYPTSSPPRKCAKRAARCAARSCARRSTRSTARDAPTGPTAPPSATTPWKSCSRRVRTSLRCFWRMRARRIDFQYERALFKVKGHTRRSRMHPPGHQCSRSARDPCNHADGRSLRQRAAVGQIGYGRRYLDPTLTSADQARQSSLLTTYSRKHLHQPDSRRRQLPHAAARRIKHL